MDISAIGSQGLQTYTAMSQGQAAGVTAFQSVLQKAMEEPDAYQDDEIMEACQSFESYFLQIIFREMRKTNFDENGFLPKSQAEKTFTDMLDEEVAKSAAKSGGIGLASMMYKQMSKYQNNMM